MKFRIRMCLFILAIAVPACMRVPPTPGPVPAADKIEHTMTMDADQIDALRGRRICIDPGHGGRYSGAVSPHGLREADVNLDVALQVWALLHRAGAFPFMTRWTDDTAVQGAGTTLRDDLQARADRAGEGAADVLVSIHHNADVHTDTVMNDLKVFYDMDDEGASFDIAMALVRKLAVSASPDKDRRKLVLPGNFRVLRESPCPAVLTEASYMTDKQNEAMLMLSSYRRQEAYAVAAGLADYFSRGMPTLDWHGEEGQAVAAGEMLKAVVEPGNGASVDPTTVEFAVDGTVVPHVYDPDERSVMAIVPPVPAGNHTASVRYRNTNGNACGRRPHTFSVKTRPRHLVVQTFPAELPATGPAFVRVTVQAIDEHMFLVGDGREVTLSVTGGTIAPETVVLEGGTTISHCTVSDESDRFEIKARMDELETVAELGRSDGVVPMFHGRVVDEQTGVPLAGATVVADDTVPGMTDSAGYFILDKRSVNALQISKTGYRRAEVSTVDKDVTFRDRTVELKPVSYKSLAGLKVAIDPQFGGTLHGRVSPTGIRAADINLRVAEFLSSYLAAAGAEPLLVRRKNTFVPQLNRVSLANEFPADLYVEIAHGAPPESDVSVLDDTGHLVTDNLADMAYVAAYPTSREGNRFADILAGRLDELTGTGDVRVFGSSSAVVTHTACPAVSIHVAEPHDEPVALRLASTYFQRREAHAILTSIAEWAGLEHRKCGEVGGVVSRDGEPVTGALVTLNGWLSLQTDLSGSYHFSLVPVGDHEITVTGADGKQHTRSLSVQPVRQTNAYFKLASEDGGLGEKDGPVQ